MSTMQNFINFYSEIVILSTSSSVGQGEAAMNILAAIALDGKVQLAAFEVFIGMKDAFANKTLACCVAGMAPDTHVPHDALQRSYWPEIVR